MKQPDQQDEFHGIGGSFVIDPDTGLRRRADEVMPAAPASAPATGAQADAVAERIIKTPRSK